MNIRIDPPTSRPRLATRCSPMSNITRITKTQWPIAALLLSQIYLLAACDEPADAEKTDDPSIVDPNSDEERSWTGYTSEEYPPLICPDQQAVLGVDCNGGYCDNVSLYCSWTGRASGTQSWQPYFSEEGSNGANESYCPGNDMWMAGIACNGGYCDNVSLLCTQFLGSTTGYCEWSGWFSEEQAPFVAPWGYFVKGVKCGGSYCDNMRYYYCWMG